MSVDIYEQDRKAKQLTDISFREQINGVVLINVQNLNTSFHEARSTVER